MDSVGVKYGCEISSLLNVKIYTRILNQNFENLLLLAPRETTTDQEPKNAGIAAPAAMPSAEMEPTGKKKNQVLFAYQILWHFFEVGEFWFESEDK